MIRPAPGFTLIEVMVVLLIVGILATSLTLSPGAVAGQRWRQELERLMDCKVFLELWVKVRSGWADDEARVRSFGYE